MTGEVYRGLGSIASTTPPCVSGSKVNLAAGSVWGAKTCERLAAQPNRCLNLC